MRNFIYLSFTCLLFLGTLSVKAQIACEDAIKMARAYENSEDAGKTAQGESLVPFLLHYIPDAPESSNLSTVSGVINPNPFLTAYIPRNISAFSSSDIQRKAPAISRFIGSINVPSTVITGLTDFLVERTKEELNIAFFQKFQATLKKHEELRLLFPETADELQTINTNIYQFNYFIQSLRTKFYVDLRNMPDHLATLMQQNHLIKDPTLNLIAYDVLGVANQITNKTTPNRIIDYLANDAYFQKRIPEGISTASQNALQDVRAGFKLLNVFSEGLSNSDPNEQFVSIHDLDALIKDTTAFKMFLGLIYQKGKDIQFGNGKTLGQLFDAQKIEGVKRTITQLVLNGTKVQKAYATIQDRIQNKQTPDYADYYNFINPTLQTLDLSIKFKNIFTTATDPVTVAYFHNVIDILRNVNITIFNLKQNDYQAAIVSGSQVVNAVLSDNVKNTQVFTDFIRFGHFMANVIEAKTSSQVSTLIEAAALPPGSSVVKKRTPFNIALNVYPGGFLGMEDLDGINHPTDNEFNTFGVTTPIGIAISKGLGSAGSLTAFGSLFDIGAMFAYRFNDDNNEANDLPAIKLENIWSPGAYLVYGFGADIPVSFGVGIQKGPLVRKVDQNIYNISQTSATRFTLFLSVDIPLTNIATTGGTLSRN